MRAGPRVRAGGVVVAVVLVAVADVDLRDRLLAGVAGPALRALALVRARAVVAGAAVLAGRGGAVVGRVACWRAEGKER